LFCFTQYELSQLSMVLIVELLIEVYIRCGVCVVFWV